MVLDKPPKYSVYIGIPAYNAQKTIADLIKRINSLGFIKKIILVNDCSTDKTEEIVGKFSEVVLINHKKNRGYGGSQKTIFKRFIKIAKNPEDVIILIHSDGQTLPEEIPIFVKAFNNEIIDLVLGSRVLGDMKKGNMPKYRILGDKILTIIQNIGFGLNLSTYASGFRGFRRKALEKTPFLGLNNKHSFDTEIILKAKQSKLRMIEVAVSTIYEEEKSNYNMVKYVFEVILLALKCYFKRILNIK